MPLIKKCSAGAFKKNLVQEFKKNKKAKKPKSKRQVVAIVYATLRTACAPKLRAAKKTVSKKVRRLLKRR